MCDCHSILECCVVFSGVTLSIRSFNLFIIVIKLMFQSFRGSANICLIGFTCT